MLKSMGLWPMPGLQGLLWNDRNYYSSTNIFVSAVLDFSLNWTGRPIPNCFNFFISSGSNFACNYKCTDEQICMHQYPEKNMQQPTGCTVVNEILEFSVHRCLSCSACQTSEGRIETRPLLKEAVPSFLSCSLQTLHLQLFVSTFHPPYLNKQECVRCHKADEIRGLNWQNKCLTE